MERRNHWTRAAAHAAMMLTLCATGLGQASAQENTPLKTDQEFINKAVSGGITEVLEARSALTKSQSTVVRAFAKQMVADHTAANTKLAAIALQEKLSYPKVATSDQSAERHALDQLTGRAFDRAYLKGQLKAHQDAVALLEGEIQNSSDQNIKTMAADILPTVKEHLSMLKQMAM